MKTATRRFCLQARNFLENQRWARRDGRTMAILLHPQNPGMYRLLLKWLRLNFPEIRESFHLHIWPVSAQRLAGSRLLIPWLQDPIPSWSLSLESEIASLQQQLTVRGIETFNPPSAHRQVARSAMVHTLKGADIRVPRVWPLESARDWDRAISECGGSLLIRKDRGHGGTVTKYQQKEMPAWNSLQRFEGAVAVEFIDTSDENGCFWKYRCLCAGSRRISVHAIASQAWEVRGGNKLIGKRERDREAKYMSTPCPHGSTLTKAAQSLGLDLVAFDYGVDQQGRLVLWEGNPNPGVSFKPHIPQLVYRHPAFHRTLAAMTHAYFEKAGLSASEPLDALSRYDSGERCAYLFKTMRTPD